MDGNRSCETIRRILRSCPDTRPEQIYEDATRDGASSTPPGAPSVHNRQQVPDLVSEIGIRIQILTKPHGRIHYALSRSSDFVSYARSVNSSYALDPINIMRLRTDANVKALYLALDRWMLVFPTSVAGHTF